MSLYLKIALITLIVTITACATNKESDVSAERATSTSQTDITRPPEFVKRNTENVEGNPEETISLEEWQKQQEEDE